MSELKKHFLNLENYSTKWEKYFDVYENLLSKYKNKNIIFIEIGVFNGGSLNLWKKYFGKNSRIIGIDINKKCKQFEDKENNIEVFIGNQSDENFWENFFAKVGKVDVILDDGGHTNLDQIITTIKTIPHINDNGLLIVEDTHTSYLKNYNSSIKYSFINFTKNIIDNLNSNIDLSLDIKKNNNLNKIIHSIEYFESIAVFKINRKKSFKNFSVKNTGTFNSIEDLSEHGSEIFIEKIKKFLTKIPLIRLNKFTKFIKNKVNNKKIKTYFK